MAIDGRSEAANKILDHCGLISDLKELSFIIITKNSIFIPKRSFVPFLLDHRAADEIHINIEDTFQVVSVPFNFLPLSSIYPNNFDSIPGPHAINIIIIGDDRHRAGRVSFGHIIRQLLKLYELLVCESAQIVDQLQSMF